MSFGMGSIMVRMKTRGDGNAKSYSETNEKNQILRSLGEL